jgi:glycerate dehydrogenase
MKICVLDGYALNPGDLSWNPLEKLGDCVVYDRTAPDKVLERAGDAEMILINKVVLSRQLIEQMPQLKYIGVLATGYNVVDVEAARQHDIPVTNVPTYGTTSVAQMAFAHLLNLTQHVAHHAQTVRDGRWATNPDFCYWDYPMIELAGLTMGIVGIGRIGRATARLAIAFGMNVLAYDVFVPSPLLEGIEFVDLDTLFERSDVISLHCPLTSETEGIVDETRLAQMKPSAFLINTSRGPLVDEAALPHALNSGQIAGAGLDVLATEPPLGENPLYHAENCFITPHISWATRSARSRLLDTAVSNVQAFLQGKPENVVN